MRPSILDPLFASVVDLTGVGKRMESVLARLLGTVDGANVRDLLFHLPIDYQDRQRLNCLADLKSASGLVTIAGHVDKHDIPPRGSRVPWRTHVSDATGSMTLVFFNVRRDWLLKTLPEGSERIFSGTLDWYSERPQIAHPDYMVAPEDAATIPLREPAYPLTAGLSTKVLHRLVDQALARIPGLPEWHDAELVGNRNWPVFSAALRTLHQPPGQIAASDAAQQIGQARNRLAYDELLASQIALILMRERMNRLAGRAWNLEGRIPEKIRGALPFQLTLSQETALDDIISDLKGPNRMLRLLQGDVGSGKTVIALLAMAAVAEAGAQAALMAPTDLLARQHYETIAPLAEKAGLVTVLLSGKDGARAQQEARSAIAAGKADIAIGTHALFQTGVDFLDLGLAVVDEQHRFGVHQRLALSAKGWAADMLVMTATPIPRTLVLTYYGDMDVSHLREKPAGRRPIETRTISADRVAEIVDRLAAAIERNEKAYWVCPLIEESDALRAVSAEDRFAILNERFAGRVGLIHGRLAAGEKDRTMADFRDGSISILVATTVVEVGVDVPDATIMIIENAERFGLAQLHQLRGRVGRSDRPSFCLLLYQTPLSSTASARLKIMRETEDGFAIAEEDLRLRGEGDLMGTRQSGFPGFRIAQADEHAELLELARDDARLLVARDPDFSSPRADALRLLLYLFGRDDAVRLMRSG